MAWGDSLPHYVTVTAQHDQDGEELEPSVEFHCGWEYGKCHFWPDCDCEYFSDGHLAEYGPGHESVHQDRCWMSDWFENGGHSYAGEDADGMGDYGIPSGMNRTGQIKVTFCDDYIEWEFA